jgi:hypothetical protein
MSPISSRRRKIDLALVAMLVLAAGGWIAWKVFRSRAQRTAALAVKAYGGWVHYDNQYFDGRLVAESPPREPTWLRRTVGDDYLRTVVHVSLARESVFYGRQDNPNARPADDVLAALESLDGLKSLELKGTQATDLGLKHLRGMTGLERLILRSVTEVSDAGAAHLAGLKHLRFLHLTKSRMTDAGLASLRGLNRLEHLNLQENHFSDAGLVHLGGLKNLKRLYLGLGDGRITDAGLVHLKGLTALNVLDLQSTLVTDAGLLQLAALPRLQELWLSEENGLVTPQGIARLKAARPGVLGIR